MAKINRKKQRRNLLILLCAFLLILGVFVKVVFMIVDTLFVSEQKVGEKQESKKENKLSKEDYTKYVVDELGNVPVMMYHGIHNIPSNETGYVGGNVDVDGYQRTAEAFRQDLQFYYDNGYRMIRLNDYINGNIDVVVKDKNEEVHIEVSDTGVGIPKDKVDIIFDRFERFDNKNAAIKEGSGIGLSIVKKLVDALGGKIEIKSEVDKGTTVRLIFKKSNSQNNLEQIYDMQHLEEKVNLEMSDIS